MDQLNKKQTGGNYMIRNSYISKILCILLIASSLMLGQTTKKQKNNSTGLAPISIVEKEKIPSLTGSFNNQKLGFLEEGFEGVTFPPAGWTAVSVKGDEIWDRVTDDFNSGTASAFIDYDYPEGEDWLITPQINIQSGATISFYLTRQYSSNYPPDYLYVYVSITDNSLTSFTLENQIFALDINSLTYGVFTQFTYDLTAYAGQNVYIAFKHVDADGNGCYLDDVKIGTPPNNDVGLLSLDIPAAVPPGAFTPKVTAKNFGLNTANYDVTLTIGNNYTSTRNVSNALFGSVVELTFDPINFELGNYVAEAYTTLLGGTDENPLNNSLTKNISCQNMETVYGFNAYGTLPSGTISFDVASPGTINVLFPYADNFLAGSAHTPNGNYSIYYSSNQFVKWEMATGQLTSLGTIVPPEGEWTGMTYDPATQKIYASCYGTNTVICTIDPQTLQTTVIATIPSYLVIAIACNGDGNIYGIEIINDVFGKYELATNTFSAIGPLGFDANYAQSLEFNYETNKLYYSAYSATSEFRLMNYQTGVSELVGPFDSGCEVDGLFADMGGAIPVELTTFEARKNNDKVFLTWITATEVNNDRFEIYRRLAESNTWELLGTVKGNGSTTEYNSYEFLDNNISKLGTYYYQLKQVDYDGTATFSKIISVENLELPVNFALHQNYPNPFNPNTTIEYSLPKDCTVELCIYDVLGNLIQKLESGYKPAGNYKYIFEAKNLSSGIYYYQIKAGDFVQVKKMMILK